MTSLYLDPKRRTQSALFYYPDSVRYISNMNELKFTAIYEEAEEGASQATSPIAGANTQGETLEETR